MRALKKIHIRNSEGVEQIIPLYTTPDDLHDAPGLAVRVDSTPLFAPLVPLHDPFASWLHIRKDDTVYAAKKRESAYGKDTLELIPSRRIVLYTAQLHNVALQYQEYTKAKLEEAETEEDNMKRQVDYDGACRMVEISSYENTLYHGYLDVIPNALDTSGLEDTSYMYYGCGDLRELDPIDTGRSQDMRSMFEECHSLPAIFPFVIDISGIRRAENMQDMFCNSSVQKVYFCNGRRDVVDAIRRNPQGILKVPVVIHAVPLTQDRYKMSELHEDYATAVGFTEPYCCVGMKSLAGMYAGCTNLRQPVDMDTSWIEDFTGMFEGCSSLTDFPFSIDVSGIRDIEKLKDMFRGTAVKKVSLSVNNPELMEQITPELLGKPDLDLHFTIVLTDAFHRMKKIMPESYATMRHIDIDLEVSEDIEDASRMFEDCEALESMEDESIMGVAYARTDFMFNNCSSLRKAPPLMTGASKDMSSMFNSCESLTELYDYDTSKNKSFSYMFNGCERLPEVYPYKLSVRNVGYANAFDKMFQRTPVKKVAFVDIDPSVRDDIVLSNIGENLQEIAYYYSLDWLVSDGRYSKESTFDRVLAKDDGHTVDELVNVTSIHVLNCSGMKDVSRVIGGLSTSKVAGGSMTLKSIGAIEETDKAENFSGMFIGCKSLESVPVIDVSGIPSAERLRNMFTATAVKSVTFKGVPENLRSGITPELLGKSDIQISFA